MAERGGGGGGAVACNALAHFPRLCAPPSRKGELKHRQQPAAAATAIGPRCGGAQARGTGEHQCMQWPAEAAADRPSN
jgi:hypothetical protein